MGGGRGILLFAVAAKGGRFREEMIFDIRTIRGKKSRRKDHGSLGRENSKCKAMSWDKECFLLDKIKVVFMASA